MSSRLSPALAEFAEGRWPDEWGTAPRRHPRELVLQQLDTVDLDARDMDTRYLDSRDLDPRSMEPPLHPSELDHFERKPRMAGFGRWVPMALVRFMAIFFIGVGATMAWQFYANATGRAVTTLLSGIGLGFLAPPPAAPVVPAAAGGYSADQLAALSRSLAAVRESVDRLAADITKLQAVRQDPPVRTSGPPATGHKPVR